MKSLFLFLSFLGTLFFVADASLGESSQYDCSGFKPFVAIDDLKADVTVSKLNEYIPGQENLPIDEANQLVCESKDTVIVPVKDIRGREADWYYCDKPSPKNYIVCDTKYKGKPAKIAVKPAMVIRHWKPKDALDTHVHVNLVPEDDETRILDTFTQSLEFDLSQRDLTLNGSSGGRGPHSDQDYFYVRVHFHK